MRVYHRDERLDLRAGEPVRRPLRRPVAAVGDPGRRRDAVSSLAAG